jgi:hypothetical protein
LSKIEGIAVINEELNTYFSLYISGQSFFDHQTGKFVSCFVFDFTISEINKLLDDVGIDELVFSRWCAVMMKEQ